MAKPPAPRGCEAAWMRALPKLVIFDLDGTLVDSVPDIATALNAALADLKFPAVSETEIRAWVGNGARVLCGRAISRDNVDRAEAALADRLLARFLARYAERVCEQSRVYDDVREALAWLAARGCRLACVTNKPSMHTEQLLRTLDLREYFDRVLGGDSLPRKKPDPLPLQECMRQLGAAPQETLMIGDSANDIDAARAANIDSICVTYGYNQGRDVFTLGANAVLETLAELPRHFSVTAHS